MKAFRCRVCQNALYFENSQCVSCGTRLGYSREERAIVPVEDGRYVDADGDVWHVCRNLQLSGCTWLTEHEGGQCFACDLTRTRPNDADAEGLAAFPVAERAKRHLVFELEGLGLPVVPKWVDEENGLAFDLLSSVDENVTIGHANGVITIDLAESRASHRERLRENLGEPYRTMLGHFRHESGHYYEWQLVEGERRTAYRELFGDETTSYQDAIAGTTTRVRRRAGRRPTSRRTPRCTRSRTSPRPGRTTCTSATRSRRRRSTASRRSASLESFSHFGDVVAGIWIPLSVALNMINRSMGQDDLYPFVIPAPVREKLDFVASLSRVRQA